MGDGAEWIWNLADQQFPDAVQIVDLYHARQHLWDLARKLYPNDTVSQKAWIKVHQKRLLDKGKIEKLVLALRSTGSPMPMFWTRFALRRTTLSAMPGVCDTQSSAVSICSSALV
jgi:transposase